MTQRIFDIENEKDMADLWDILPDSINEIIRNKPADYYLVRYINNPNVDILRYININWHDKTEITRPIQEATEADIGKLCVFWSIEELYFGELRHIENTDTGKFYEMSAPIAGNLDFLHCRRLTKQEIEEIS